jgi:hypothetical protein
MTPSFQEPITRPGVNRPGARLAATLLTLSLVIVAALVPAPAAAKPFHGFCHCSGTFTPDCNTRADCLGGACLSSPTFC